MKIKVVDNVYTELNTEKSFKKLLRRIAMKRPVAGLYLITEPLYETGIMEIYSYNELLQPYYRKMRRKLNVYGVATSRDKAKKLLCDILDDSYRLYGGPDIKQLSEIGG